MKTIFLIQTLPAVMRKIKVEMTRTG